MGMIEELIQQKNFSTEHEKASISLLYASNMLCDFHQNFLKQFDITPQQYNVLRILRGQQSKPITIGLLKDRMIDRNSDISRMVERLRKAELIKRLVSKNDKRAVDVIISEKGLSLLTQIDNYKEELSEPLKALNVNELEVFNALMDKLLKGLSNRLS
jgi:DNA-binding MarR family transcriptional regulator